jgi:hypothetical protein
VKYFHIRLEQSGVKSPLRLSTKARPLKMCWLILPTDPKKGYRLKPSVLRGEWRRSSDWRSFHRRPHKAIIRLDFMMLQKWDWESRRKEHDR